MSEAAELEIHAAETGGPGIHAVLRNRSAGPRKVLRSDNLQPSRVILKEGSGHEVRPFDERTRRKFDRTVRAAAFVSIPPNGDVDLGTEQFRRAGSSYELSWGPFRYRDLAPGEYRVKVIFESTIDEDSQGAKIPGAWKGTVSSHEFSVRLP